MLSRWASPALKKLQGDSIISRLDKLQAEGPGNRRSWEMHVPCIVFRHAAGVCRQVYRWQPTGQPMERYCWPCCAAWLLSLKPTRSHQVFPCKLALPPPEVTFSSCTLFCTASACCMPQCATQCPSIG